MATDGNYSNRRACFFSTIITMIIVPVMYGLMGRSGERNKIMKLRKQFNALDD